MAYKWKPDNSLDAMPGGPTARKPFEGEDNSYGWTPYDDQPGLGSDPQVVAAPPGYWQLWIVEGEIVRSPIVAWQVHAHGHVEWHALLNQYVEADAEAVLTPDGTVCRDRMTFRTIEEWIEWEGR